MAKGNEVFETTVSSLMQGVNGFLSTKTVVGEAITYGDTTIIPLVNVSFGMGAGSFGNTDKTQTGGGMGGSMTPSAVLVIHEGKTRLINVTTRNGMERLLDFLPDFVESFKDRAEGKKRGTSKEEKAAREAAAESMGETIERAAEMKG